MPEINFQNTTPSEVRVYWQDDDAAERLYRVLEPGESYVQEGRDGQCWRLEAVAESGVAETWRATDEPEQVVEITDDGLVGGATGDATSAAAAAFADALEQASTAGVAFIEGHDEALEAAGFTGGVS